MQKAITDSKVYLNLLKNWFILWRFAMDDHVVVVE